MLDKLAEIFLKPPYEINTTRMPEQHTTLPLRRQSCTTVCVTDSATATIARKIAAAARLEFQVSFSAFKVQQATGARSSGNHLPWGRQNLKIGGIDPIRL